MASISRFHVQIIQLFACVFMWVHWDACLQYGACASQPSTRSTLSVVPILPHKAGMPQIANALQVSSGQQLKESRMQCSVWKCACQYAGGNSAASIARENSVFPAAALAGCMRVA